MEQLEGRKLLQILEVTKVRESIHRQRFLSKVQQKRGDKKSPRRIYHLGGLMDLVGVTLKE